MEFVNIKGKRIFEKIVDQIESAIMSGTLARRSTTSRE